MAFSNAQYNAIMRGYERIRTKARADLHKRIEEVYARIPELRDLDGSVGAAALRQYRAYVHGGESSGLQDFSQEMKRRRERKAFLLQSHGFPADYMELRYICEDCKDSGMTESGRCHCFRAKLVESLYEKSNIRRILEKENFDTFRLDYFDDERIIGNIGMSARAYMEKILRMCRKYVAEFTEKKGSLLFTGNTGVGKSFLGNCIAKALLDNCHTVIYLSSTDLFAYLSKAQLDRDEDDEALQMQECIDEAELLIIDDLGTEAANAWSNSQLFRILNQRLNSEKATIISTNLSLNMIREIYSERLSSRIASLYTVIPLYGDDIRKKDR